MCEFEFWRTESRPARFDENVAIHERKPIHAKSINEARQLISAIPAVTIGNSEYKPSLIEGMIPRAALDDSSSEMPIGETITTFLEDQDSRGIEPLSRLHQ